ncbi:MAG TPA: hypothetical protein VD997_16465 [Phycisphaerales bacterium]|nr:hypothetical protein [Phycisphaerales bacterium]
MSGEKNGTLEDPGRGSESGLVGLEPLRGRGDRGEEPVPTFKLGERRPPELTLLPALDAIPGPRLQEIATCLGLWNIEGLNRDELIRLMQRAPLVNVDAVWTQMSTLERGLARRALAKAAQVCEVKPPAEPPVVRSLFEVLDPRVLSTRLGLGMKDALLAGVESATRRLFSLLTLLSVARLTEVGRTLGLECKDHLSLARGIEHHRVPTREVLAVMTDRELRTAMAVWAVTAPREEVMEHLAQTIDGVHLGARERSPDAGSGA